MIVMDRPRVWERGKRPSAHLVSDLTEPAAAQAELYDFAAELGLKEAWLQERGTAREHFDLWGGRLEAAREAGARTISHAAFREVLKAKRDAWRRRRLGRDGNPAGPLFEMGQEGP